jgi:type IX secretion system PorP/SprF family membrane protein
MRVRLIIVLCYLSYAALAQYVPNNAQAYQLASIYNPSFSGVEDFSDLKLGYRNQWSGFGANAPKFINLSFNTRLKQPLDLSYNSMRISKSSLVQTQNIPKNKRIIHGLSVNIFQSEIGTIKQVGGSIGYAFNYPLSKRTRLAIGLAALIDNQKVRLGELTFGDNVPDPFVKNIVANPVSQLNLNLRAGFLLYSNKFYFGASYLPVVIPIESSGLSLNETFYLISVHGGISFPLSSSIDLKPSVLAYMQMDNTFLIDYNVKFYLANRAWVGATYRSSNIGVGLLGINATSFLSIAYSYEVSFGGLQQFADSSHEVIAILKFNNFRKRNSSIW